MAKDLSFGGVRIALHGASLELLDCVAKGTWLAEGSICDSGRIDLVWSEDFGEAPPPPHDAVTVFETELILSSGERRPYSSHRSGDCVWKRVGGCGLVLLDYAENSACVWRNPKEKITAETLLLLFANPLAGLLAAFGHTRLHAACASVNGRGALLTGLSGRGKSTAAFALLAAGHAVVTDETSIVRKGPAEYSCRSILNTVKIGEASRNVFFRDFPAEYEKLGDEYRVRIPSLQPGNSGAVENIRTVLLLNQTGLRDTEIVPASPMEAMPELLPVSMDISSERNMERCFSAVSDLLGGVEVDKVLFGTDMARFAHAIGEYLEGLK